MGSLSTELPYWQVNVAPSQREDECPAFLRNLSKKDQGIISTPDAEYHIQTWPEVQKLVADNRLDLFQRIPSELRRYIAYNFKLKQEYGSVMNFVLTNRLEWTAPILPRGKPFEDPEDIKILWNDWPYGIDERIVHLVVWTKFELEDDPETDDLTPAARAKIDAFVQATFSPSLTSDRYIWFKNWRSLKSVHAVEHFHVMLFDPPTALADELTKGDVPLSRKIST